MSCEQYLLHPQGTRNTLSPHFNSFGGRFISLTEELQRKQSIKLAEPKQDFPLGRNWVFWVTVSLLLSPQRSPGHGVWVSQCQQAKSACLPGRALTRPTHHRSCQIVFERGFWKKNKELTSGNQCGPNMGHFHNAEQAVSHHVCWPGVFNKARQQAPRHLEF